MNTAIAVPKVSLVKHAGGAPTKYRPIFHKRAGKYIHSCKDEQIKLLKSEGAKGESFENKIKVNLPSIEGFALFLGVSIEAMEEWREKYPEFKRAINRIKLVQKKILMDNGLSGNYNPIITKLLLSSNHGMRDTDSDRELGGERIGSVLTIIHQQSTQNITNVNIEQPIKAIEAESKAN